ncbi:MAG TPA: class I SAM-dependent methyltransferase [Ktedonosporobacter sp.]|jgi:SAM-dependent methyltransferase|nr:class I SAM-dependent methyltransferase [Ktedonosporobacter sp.]
MEKAANSYIINVESGAEMARLIDQDKFVTKCMGGLFPEIPDLAKVGSTLDVACGPGGWAQELAYTYPDMRVVGIDISQRMIEYAKALSQVQGLDNAEFRVMDLLQPLDFPDASFDLINARFLVGFVHADGWVPLMKELMRILRPGGTIRFTDSDGRLITSSPAFEKLMDLLMQAFYLDGRNLSGSPSHVGLTPLLGRFLREVGCQNVQEKVHLLNYSAGMEAYTGVCEDVRVGFKLVQPFLVKMKVAEQEEVEQLYEQTLAEWLSEDFRGLWYFLSAWGQKPV